MLIQKKLTQHPLKKTTINNDSEYVTFSNIKEIMKNIKKYSNNPVLLITALFCGLLTIIVQYLPDFLFAKYLGGCGLIVSLVLMIVKSLIGNQLSKPNKIMNLFEKGVKYMITWLKNLTKTQIISGICFIVGFVFTCISIFVPEIAQYSECLYSALSLTGVSATAGIAAGKKTATQITDSIKENVFSKKELKEAEKEAKEQEKEEHQKRVQAILDAKKTEAENKINVEQTV